ncbi:MAG: hypothetical protein ACREL5_02785 [Gemmatimonadales bacterium]
MLSRVLSKRKGGPLSRASDVSSDEPLIFNRECSVRALRVHDPATADKHGLEDKGFISTTDWHAGDVKPRNIGAWCGEHRFAAGHGLTLHFRHAGSTRSAPGASLIHPCRTR